MGPINLSSWLAGVDSKKYVTDIGIVLSHDAMAYKGYSSGAQGTYLTQAGSNLADQFAGGVRRFDLRTSREKVDKTWFNFEHGTYRIGDDSNLAFGQLIKSLAYNPSEFIAFNINPYEPSVFASNNPGVTFWDTLAGKRVHSIFFTDGSALSGTPRIWSDEVFNLWAPGLPEEKRELLRGKPMFYTPRFGANNTTIPTIDELRGKFLVGTDSWTQGRSYTYQELYELDPSYAKDFPKGISWNPGDNENEDPTKARMDLYSYYYLYQQRDKTKQFVQNLISKNDHSASFLGLYNANGANVVGGWFGQGLWGSHSDLWFNDYNGDDGTPNFLDLLKSGKGLSPKATVGSIRGTFMTDFAVRKNRGTTPAEIITSLQPRVDVITGVSTNYLKEGNVLRLNIQSNTSDLDLQDFIVAVDGLSDSFDSSDFIVKGGLVKTDQFISTSSDDALSDRVVFVDPGSDDVAKLKFIRNDKAPEYFTVQLINKETGNLFGAPQIFDLL